MNRFHNIHDLETLSRQWREVARKVHPDVGGSEEEFKAVLQDFTERKVQIEDELKMEKVRAERMQFVGTLGSVLTKMSKGEDWTTEAATLAKAVLPAKYSTNIDLVAYLLKETK